MLFHVLHFIFANLSFRGGVVKRFNDNVNDICYAKHVCGNLLEFSLQSREINCGKHNRNYAFNLV